MNSRRKLPRSYYAGTLEQRGANSTFKFISVIRKYTDVKKLDAALLNELIDKIVVHHKEKSDDGRTYQQIEIFYRFVRKLDTAYLKAA